jgi:methyl-accepting chemotaxis protein
MLLLKLPEPGTQDEVLLWSLMKCVHFRKKTHRSTGEIQNTIQTLQDIVGKATVLMKSSEKLALSTVSESDLVTESFNDINVSIQNISDILSDNSIDANEQSNVLNAEANKLYDSVSIYTV